MSEQIKIKIANAFYSKPRGAFLPLTAGDVLTRTGLSEHVISTVWIGMFRDETIAVTRKAHGDAIPAIYELTPTGRRLAGVAA